MALIPQLIKQLEQTANVMGPDTAINNKTLGKCSHVKLQHLN